MPPHDTAIRVGAAYGVDGWRAELLGLHHMVLTPGDAPPPPATPAGRSFAAHARDAIRAVPTETRSWPELRAAALEEVDVTIAGCTVPALAIEDQVAPHTTDEDASVEVASIAVRCARTRDGRTVNAHALVLIFAATSAKPERRLVVMACAPDGRA